LSRLPFLRIELVQVMMDKSVPVVSQFRLGRDAAICTALEKRTSRRSRWMQLSFSIRKTSSQVLAVLITWRIKKSPPSSGIDT